MGVTTSCWRISEGVPAILFWRQRNHLHVYELFRSSSTGWNFGDLTVVSGAPVAGCLSRFRLAAVRIMKILMFASAINPILDIGLNLTLKGITLAPPEDSQRLADVIVAALGQPRATLIPRQGSATLFAARRQ